MSFDVRGLDGDSEKVTVSPSLFHVLASLSEEEEEDELELMEDGDGLEEGELLEESEKSPAKGIKKGAQEALSANKLGKNTKGSKEVRKPASTTRDLKLQNIQGHSKSSSSQKI